MTEQVDLVMRLESAGAVRRKDGVSVFTYRIHNDGTRKRQAQVVTDRSDGETMTDVASVEAGEHAEVTVELAPDVSGVLRAGYTSEGEWVEFAARLIGPLPTEGFEA